MNTYPINIRPGLSLMVILPTVLVSVLKTGMKLGLVMDSVMMVHGVYTSIAMNLIMTEVTAAMF